MTMNMENLYWQTNKEWYRINNEGKYELTEKATERAKKVLNYLWAKKNASLY